MMEGGAFILLKACRRQPGNAEQAEILLAGLPKILRIAGFGSENPPFGGGNNVQSLCSRRFSAGYG
jgi:hypothetical protein